MPFYHAVDEFAEARGYDTTSFTDELKTLLDAEIQKPEVLPIVEEAMKSDEPVAALQTLAENSVAAALDEQVHDPETIPFAEIGRVVGDYVSAVTSAMSEMTDPQSSESDAFYGMLARGEDPEAIGQRLAERTMQRVYMVPGRETEEGMEGFGQLWETALSAAVPSVINVITGTAAGRPTGKPFRSDWQLTKDAEAAWNEIKAFGTQSDAAFNAVAAVKSAIDAANAEGLRNNVEGLRQNVQAAMGLIATIKQAIGQSMAPQAQAATDHAGHQVTLPPAKTLGAIFSDTTATSTLSYLAMGVGAVVVIMLATKGTAKPKA